MDDAPLETTTTSGQVSTPDAGSKDSGLPPGGTGMVQRILRPLILVVLIGAAVGGYYLYEEGQRHPSTDDAYVQANVVQIAPMVSGIVSRVHVVNNQHVEDGVPLFDLDTAPFVIAVEAAQASFDEAVESVGASGAGVAAAAAHVREAEAALANARNEASRARALSKAGSMSASMLDTREAALKQMEAGLAAALAEMDRAQQMAGRSGKDNARLRSASAALHKAQLDLSYAEVRAPATGWVSNVTVREGAIAPMARPVFALVEDSEWWVDAHFKETDITRLKPGQSAEITVDMYPGVTLHGVVDSISAGSGATFSLLPPENASGNWVKVTQRYTVRIKVTEKPPSGEPLRVGASAKATVDTGKEPGK
jgi:membrane fusion protein (multidrug efflux system)